jgi:glucokinase
MAANGKKYWAGFDLGGTKMFVTVFDQHFTPLAVKRKKTKGYEGMEAGLSRMVKTVQQACEEAQIEPAALTGIGVGCPGPLDLKKGILKEAANLGWSNVPVRKTLQDAFGCPVVLGNDVDVGVLGEYHSGAGKGAHGVLGIFPGTGIGAGFVYEGKVLRGKNSSCLEFGHIQIQPQGPLCGCGKYGCLEAVASRLAIAGEAVKAAYRGQAPALLEACGMDLSKVRSGALKKAIDGGDQVVEQIVRDGARWLGTGVAIMVNLLAPDIVILGGGLVEALPDLFKKNVTEAANTRVMPGYRNTFTVKTAELGDDAGVTGAALMARDEITA